MQAEALVQKSRINVSVQVLTGFVVFAGICLILSFLSSALLGDPDTQWHIASGRLMFETLKFPVIDPFSYTFAGQPWIAKEWGGQLALGAAFLTGGWSGVTVLAAAFAAFAYAIAAAHAARFIEPLYVVALITLCALAGSLGFVARPHIVTLPLFALFAIGLLNAMNGARGYNPPWLLVPVMLIWANCHGLFTLGFAMAAAAGLHVLVNCPANQRWRMVGLWFGFGLALLAAACITPYGWQPIVMTLTIADGEPMAFIKEWEPLPLNASGWAAYALLAVGLLACLKNPKANLGRILIIGFFGYLMANHMRFVLQFSIAVAIMAAAPLSTFLPRRFSEPTIGAGGGLALIAGVVFAAILASGFAFVQPEKKPPSRVFPLEALQAAKLAGLSGPVFNSYGFGGFLTLQGIPTFVDGRTDQLFNGGFRLRLEDALTAQSPDPLSAFLKPYAPRWAIISPNGNEQRQLTALGWAKIYEDSAALVLKAP